MTISYRRKENIKLALAYLVIVIMLIYVLFPVVWTFISSLNPGDSLYSSQLTFFPKKITWRHYKRLFTETNFGNWYWNTLKVAVATSVITVILVTFTAYAFSRLQFYGRRFGLIAMLGLQMFPGIMNMVAIYVLLNLFGLLDTHLGLIVIYAGGAIPYNTWLMKGYMDGISRSLEEAAIIDGANNWTIMWWIIFPLILPMVSVIAIFSFVAPFGDFLFARLVLTTPTNWTLAVGLHDFVLGRFGQRYTLFAAGSLLAALPITILYLSLQGLLIEGLTGGSVKG